MRTRAVAKDSRLFKFEIIPVSAMNSGARSYHDTLTSGCLGVSLGQSYYSSDRIREYFSWAKLKVQNFSFLIGDDVHKYTYAAVHNCNLNAAKIVSANMAQNVIRMIDRVAGQLNSETAIRSKIYDPPSKKKQPEPEPLLYRVILWRDVRKIPLYSEIFCEASKLYRFDGHFARSVKLQVQKSLGQRSILDSTDPDLRYRLFLLDLYVLHEISGLIAISERTEYSLEIYPGPSISLIDDIYRNRWPTISSLLRPPRKRKYLSLYLDGPND